MNMKSSQMKQIKRWKVYILIAALLLILSGFLLYASTHVSGFAQWYALHIYPLLVNSIGRILGVLPFSVAEFLLYVLVITFFISLIGMILRTKRYLQETNRPKHFTIPLPIRTWCSTILLAAGILVFLYTIGCGINYQRDSFTEEEGLETTLYSTDELAEVCVWLTEQVNMLADDVSRDAEGIMYPDAKRNEGAIAAMGALSETYPSLSGYYPQPKAVYNSALLSYQSVTGVYSPFTFEANYNQDMTGYGIPFTMCHELSHLRGFMEEKEANFIAFLACIGSDRVDFVYSGYLSGWVYCMNALYRVDRERWQEIHNMLCEEANADLIANNTFWDSYEGTISETHEQINDTYLKANGQSEGVQSYDRVVDLILAWYQENML